MYEEAVATLVRIIVLVNRMVVLWRLPMKKVERLIFLCVERILTLEDVYGGKTGS